MNTIFLADVNRCHLAQFIDVGHGQILGFPTTAGFSLYQRDVGDPRWVPPGILMTPEGFLGFLARVAATDKGDGTHCTVYTSGGPAYSEVHLTRTMKAGDLAKLTGYDIDEVRQFLREHLTFGDDPC